jgi:hypothetical protein
MKPWVRCGILLAKVAAVIYGPMLAIYAYCITGWGGWSIAGVEFLVVPASLAIPVLALALIGLCIPRTRQVSKCAVVIASGVLLLFPPVVWASGTLRSHGFRRAAERAAPVVAAIERFERERGQPPSSIEQLVPHYLPSLPAGIPKFEIVAGDVAARDYYGNRWVLFANVPTGMINWDVFLYFPNGQYPDKGYGGWLERIGAWAYVHE